MVAAPQLGCCGTEPLRCTYPVHYPLRNRIRLRTRTNRIFAVATEPKPTPTGSSKPVSPDAVNGSSRSPPSPNSVNGSAKSMSLKSVNGVSTVSQFADPYFYCRILVVCPNYFINPLVWLLRKGGNAMEGKRIQIHILRSDFNLVMTLSCLLFTGWFVFRNGRELEMFRRRLKE